MLSRTANNLFWIARYMERSDYIARLLEVAQRTSSFVTAGGRAGNEWESALIAAGGQEIYNEKYDAPTAVNVMDFLIRDRDNPSSIVSCLETARDNARAVRGGLTRDTWDAINSTWLDASIATRDARGPESLNRTIDWVRERSLLFLGAYTSTMLRHDSYFFMRLGTFLERADNTARILDVKYHILLPDYSAVGGALDYHQWTAILRAVSAARSYHRVYADRVKPWNVAELLILRPEMPRSMRACYDRITEEMESLGQIYGGRYGECHRLAGDLHARLKFRKTDDIFKIGLHEFLTAFVESTADLGKEISKFYLF